MGHLLKSSRRRKCRTENRNRNRKLSELVVNIETGGKLSETIGTVEELSTFHDEWPWREKKREKKKRSKECATRNRVNIDWSHLGDYLKEPTTARWRIWRIRTSTSGLGCVRTRAVDAPDGLDENQLAALTHLLDRLGETRLPDLKRAPSESHLARCERVFFFFELESVNQFLHGYFDTAFPSAQSCRAVHHPKARVKRTSARTPRSLATWPESGLHTGYEPKEFDKITSVDGDTTPINDPNHNSISDFSKTTRENIGLFRVPTMFETFVSHDSRADFDLQQESQESMPRETVARERVREEREGSVISVAESMSRKSRRSSIRSHSLQIHREIYSDERDLREHLERRAQRAILGENSGQRKF